MRKIKFRAWDKEQKIMFSAEEMGEDELTLAVDGRGFVNVSNMPGIPSGYAGDKMIPLQYTGYIDKNGKEIYEGDIIRYSYRSNLTVIEWREKEAQWSMGGYHSESVEVIGNIYENPELLKS